MIQKLKRARWLRTSAKHLGKSQRLKQLPVLLLVCSRNSCCRRGLTNSNLFVATASKKQFLNALQEREKFEEDHMMRLQLSKTERKSLKQQRKLMGTLPNELHELEKWSDMTRVDRSVANDAALNNPKKRSFDDVLKDVGKQGKNNKRRKLDQ